MKSSRLIPWLAAAAIAAPLVAANAADDGEPMRLDVAQMDNVTAGVFVAFDWNFDGASAGNGPGGQVFAFIGEAFTTDVGGGGVAGAFVSSSGSGVGADATATSQIVPTGNLRTYARNVDYRRSDGARVIANAVSAASAYSNVYSFY